MMSPGVDIAVFLLSPLSSFYFVCAPSLASFKLFLKAERLRNLSLEQFL